jgi:hypothetical protein
MKMISLAAALAAAARVSWRKPRRRCEERVMKPTLLAAVLFVALWSPAHARTWERHEHAAWKTSSLEHGLTCSTVRAAVALWGLNQARQIALEHGMTPGQELRARRCLASAAP